MIVFSPFDNEDCLCCFKCHKMASPSRLTQLSLVSLLLELLKSKQMNVVQNNLLTQNVSNKESNASAQKCT